MNVCAEVEPPLTELGNGHSVSCWLMDERADRSGLKYDLGGGING